MKSGDSRPKSMTGWHAFFVDGLRQMGGGFCTSDQIPFSFCRNEAELEER